MIFRQLFHQETGTYTYLLASRKGGEALLIDGVLDRGQTGICSFCNSLISSW